MTTRTDGCTCDPTGSGPDMDEGPQPGCPIHGLDFTTVDGLAAALRFAGVEIGSVGGERFRQVAAERILPLLTAKFADVHARAYRQGIEDERTSVEQTGGAIGPNRVNPYAQKA